MGDRDREISRTLFGGGTKLPHGTFQFPPASAELSAPFEWDKAVARAVCQKCSMLVEINIHLARQLAEWGGFLLPPSLAGMYFDQAECPMCSDDSIGIVLKKITNA